MKRSNADHLRIVFVSFDYWPPDFGGELLISIERLQTLAARGHSVEVLTRRPAGTVRAERDGAININRCPVEGRGFAARVIYVLWAAIRLLRMSFDTMHLCSAPGMRAPTRALAVWLFASIAKVRGARTVSVVSLADSETEAWQIDGRTGFFRSFHYHRIDHIIAVSPALFQALRQWRPRKAALITCGVRDDIFTPLSVEERRAAREKLGIPEDGVVFVTIGSAGRRKGYDLLAEAFGALGPNHPNWFLLLIGPISRAEGCGTDEGELAEMLAPLRECETQVRKLGRIDDRSEIRRLLGASDIFVFPTRREGMPIAPMEAMAMNLPVIVSRIIDVTDVACVNRETGLFVPVGNVGALIRAMARLGNNPMLRAVLGRQARQRIQKDFSWEQHVQLWEDLYSRGACPEIRRSQTGRIENAMALPR